MACFKRETQICISKRQQQKRKAAFQAFLENMKEWYKWKWRKWERRRNLRPWQWKWTWCKCEWWKRVTEMIISVTPAFSRQSEIYENAAISENDVVRPWNRLTKLIDFQNYDSFTDSDNNQSEVEAANIGNGPNHQFKNKLAAVAIECKIPGSTVNKLLKVMREEPAFAYLPSDCRTLLHCPQETMVCDMNPGKYIHST